VGLCSAHSASERGEPGESAILSFRHPHGMLAWRELFFSPTFFKPTPTRTQNGIGGPILSRAASHCSDCHSPRNFMGAIKGRPQYTGTEIDGF